MPAPLGPFAQFVSYGRDPRAETLRRIVGPMFATGGNPVPDPFNKPYTDHVAAMGKALGLKHLIGFTLNASADGLATLTSEQHATQHQIDAVADEIVKRRWRLVEIDDQGRDVVQPWSVPPAQQSRPAETRQSTRTAQGETAAELERDAMPGGWTATQVKPEPQLTKRDEFYLGLLALHARSVGLDIAANAIDDIIKRLGVRTT